MTLSSIELMYDYLEDHVRLAHLVKERRPVSVGILGFMIGGLSVFLSQALTHRLHLLSFSWTSLAVIVVWKIVAGFILAALLHLILELQGRRGDVVELFILFGLADLAWALSVPLVLIARVATPSQWIVSAAFLLVGFFSLSLKARSLQDAYEITSGKAWFTLGLPYLALVAGTLLALSLLLMRLVMLAFKAVS